MDASRFFEDNRRRISSSSDPVAHNTNEGLLALAKLVQEQASVIDDLRTQLSDVQRKVRNL